MQATSIYIHIPFCLHRCGYCDFNTYAGLEKLIPVYAEAVCQEIDFISKNAKDRLTAHTIYFGGGTPSLLPIESLKTILVHLQDDFDLVNSVEISMEANPGTLSEEYLDQLPAIGVNRISLGMQSANPSELALLERQHSFEDVVNAVKWARKSGIDNLNLDLIFGLPYQSTADWKVSVEQAMDLQPEHLSLYALTLEHGTPMQKKIEAGMLPDPDQDLAADMYEQASEILSNHGYVQYEISNWALEKDNEFLSCRHNVQYWKNLPYIGIGAGAHGYINRQRTENVLTPGAYIKRMKARPEELEISYEFPRTPATQQTLPIDYETEIAETMMMGLRLVNEGVSAQEFRVRFGIDLYERFSDQIDRLMKVGLLEWFSANGEHLRLTQKGYLLGNQVFREFI